MKDSSFIVMLLFAIVLFGGMGGFMIWRSLNPRDRGPLADDGVYYVYKQAQRINNVFQFAMGVMLMLIVVCALIAFLITVLANPTR